MADNENNTADEQPPSEQVAEEAVTSEVSAPTEDVPEAEAQPEEQHAGESGEEGEEQAAAEATEAPADADSGVVADQKPAEAEGEGQAEAEKTEAVAEGEAEPKSPEEEAAEHKEEEEEKKEEEAEAKEAEGGAAEEEKGEDKHEGEGGEGPTESTEKEKEGTEEEGGAKSPVPQSDSFTEGEKPEMGGMQIGENLSREATPTSEERLKEAPERLEAGTPERLEDEMEQQDETEDHAMEKEQEATAEGEKSPLYDRDVLIERYHMALSERENLLQQNYQLQNKLAEYFRKKKNDERPEYDKNVTDQEQRYLKYMAQLDELHMQDISERENYQHQIEEMRNRCEEKREKVDEEVNHFTDFKKQVATNAINSRSGKPIAPKDIEQYMVTMNKKEQEVVHVRLENIKLKNKLKKKEMQLKSKEELAEGLHLIDFEQLKIENQTYNEKIEERNEELLKLRKKITSTVQVLTHLKEKLQFVQGENQIQRGKLQEVEALVGQKRDVLSRTKQARDSLRIDNNRLRQNCGLLGNEALLRDFEERKDESDELNAQLDRLKMQHAELTLTCNQVRRKIEQSRNVRQ